MTDEEFDFERGRSKWSKFHNQTRGGGNHVGFPNNYSEQREVKRPRVTSQGQGGYGGPLHRSSNNRHRDMYEPPGKRARYYWDHDDRHSSRDGDVERTRMDTTTESSFQPSMLTFKAFLSNQDDTINEDEAMEKYGEYKAEFRRQQLNEFFTVHKGEEWFRDRFHPQYMAGIRFSQVEGRVKRAQVFWEMYDKLSQARLDVDMQDDLVTLMDIIVIKLEGGTEDHIEAYINKTDHVDSIATENSNLWPNSEHLEKKVDENVGDEDKLVEERSQSDSGEIEDPEKTMPEDGNDHLKLSVSGSEYSNVSRSSSANIDDDLELSGNASDELDEVAQMGGNVPVIRDEIKPHEAYDEFDHKEGVSGANMNTTASVTDEPSVFEHEAESANLAVGSSEPLPQVDGAQDDVDLKDDLIVDPTLVEPPMTTPEPSELVRPLRKNLHSTVSIHLRNIPATITRAELELVCSKYEGFLRLALSDPTPDKKWFRRGWVTFAKGSNVKEICCLLGDIRLGGVDLGPVINRELSKRIRLVAGLVNDKKVVRNNIKLASKIIQNMDRKWGLDEELGGVKLMGNITDYLVEEASAEEDELLGINMEDGEVTGGMVKIQREERLLSMLDKLIVYLRVVHSIDFYNHSEYPYEDQMPNRLGLLHIRGPMPKDEISQQELDDYVENFEKKIEGFLTAKEDLSEEDIVALGAKREEDEVEKFILQNSQELAKDKWLCPLSGKKFKGPEFIRKHIMSKYAGSLELVKAEVQYYNNYLKDPKRPQLPEKPIRNPIGEKKYEDDRSCGRLREATRYPVFDRRGGWNRPPPHYRGGGGGHNRGWGGQMRDRGGYNTREDPRSVVDYSDFDSPYDW